MRSPPDAQVAESLEMMARQELSAAEDTLILALTYRCNSACSFCIIATEIAQGLPEAPESLLREVFQSNAATGRFRRLTFSGAEVTLRPDLPRICERATSEGGFEVVRIQTNARRLGDRGLVRELMQAGCTEYFVSLHAHTSQLDRAITGSRRSFEEAVAGLEVLLEEGAQVWTNTVICRDNVQHLPEIVAFLGGLGVPHVELWSFLEVADPRQAQQHAPLAQVMPQVRRALDEADRLGLESVAKWLPRCLLGPHAHKLDNHQPQMVIRDEFQRRLGQSFGFSCVHGDCRWLGRGCDGLHQTYRSRFGDERELLCPS